MVMAVSRVLLHWAPRRFLISQLVTGSISSLPGSMVSRARKAKLVASDPPATALVIDAEGVSDIDTTAIQQLDELLDDLDDADVAVAFARVRKPVRDMVQRSGMLDRLGGDDAIFLEVDDAVEHFTSNGTE